MAASQSITRTSEQEAERVQVMDLLEVGSRVAMCLHGENTSDGYWRTLWVTERYRTAEGDERTPRPGSRKVSATPGGPNRGAGQG